MTNFGASFKQARESKGVSLEQIAAETRISTRFLRAIENEEFSLLPGGIFNRGFVRAFAEKVGLDADQAIADYERLTGAPHRVEAPPEPEVTPARKQRPLYPVAVAALLVVVAIFYIVTRDSGRGAETGTAPAQPQVSPTQTPAAPVPPAPQSTPTAGAENSAVQPDPDLTPPPSAPPAPAQVAQSLTLEVKALEQTWIKVVSDGKTAAAGEVLQPGTARKFTASISLRLSVGNAGGLSLKLNDKSMKPLGKRGQVREVTITPGNAKDFTQ